MRSALAPTARPLRASLGGCARGSVGSVGSVGLWLFAGAALGCGPESLAPPLEGPTAAPSCAAVYELAPLVASGELFYGYLSLGEALGPASCASPGSATGATLTLGLGPDLDGPLVLSTRHPSTNAQASLEVTRAPPAGDACAGEPVACGENAELELTVEVEAGERTLVHLRATPDAPSPSGSGEGVSAEGAQIVALGVRRPGVCDGLGQRVDAEGLLLPGGTFQVDTTTGPSSARGSCASSQVPPEAVVRLVAPRSGTMLATTTHPSTTFDTLLHVRRGSSHGGDLCGSPEAELACAKSGADTRGGFLRFPVEAGLTYDLFVDGDDGGPSGERPFGRSWGTATVRVGYDTPSPATAALEGCDHLGIRDRYLVFAAAGETVRAAVDTVDTETAADLRLMLSAPDGQVLGEADDELACTFSPPAYGCPELSAVAPTTGLYALEIYVGASEQCADPSTARYLLDVSVAEGPAPLVLERDQ